MQDYPTFVGLGALKAGTTLLHTWLADHPQVCVPRDRKEVDFFSRYYDRGMDWYRSLFEPAGERAVGEFSVTYLDCEQAVRRIAADLPHARCLVSLRDPVARLDSQYRHFVKVAGYAGDIPAYLRDHPNALERGLYAGQLRRLLDRFPPDQVKILVFEDFIADPVPFVRELYEFVGVDPAHEPRSLHERVNPTTGVRWRSLQRLRQRVSSYATTHDVRWLLRAGRRLPLARLLSRPGGDAGLPARMPPAQAAELRRRYEPDIERTSQMIGRDLTLVWRTGAD